MTLWSFFEFFFFLILFRYVYQDANTKLTRGGPPGAPHPNKKNLSHNILTQYKIQIIHSA